MFLSTALLILLLLQIMLTEKLTISFLVFTREGMCLSRRVGRFPEFSLPSRPNCHLIGSDGSHQILHHRQFMHQRKHVRNITQKEQPAQCV